MARSPTLAVWIAACAVIVAGMLLAGRADAHPAVDAELHDLDARIAAGEATRATLLRRAELHRLEGDWALAESDYARVAARAPQDPDVTLGRAGLARDQGRLVASEALLDRLLGASFDVRGYAQRAEVRAGLGRFAAAAADLDVVIDAGAAPAPDAYVMRARWLMAAGPVYWTRALAGIDAGLARLGDVPGLLVEAWDIESRLGRFDAARARIDRLTAITLGGAGANTPAAGPDRVDPALRVVPVAPCTPDLDASPPIITRGPYLQSAAPTRVVIRWRTAVPTDSRVRLGPWLADVPHTGRRLADGDLETTEHELAITGLTPGMRYAYSVGSRASLSDCGRDSLEFTTPPLPGTPQPTRIWIVGDSGTANANVVAVRDAFRLWSHGAPYDVWLMLGDNAYTTGSDAEYQTAVFDMFAPDLARHALWPTRGNHDFLHPGADFDYYDVFTLPRAGECGGLPSGSEAYYSFDHANVHFVCLDSEGSDRTRTGPMMTWLASDLAATTQPWIIAFWHHPPYSKGSHDSDNPLDSEGKMTDMRQVALPILDSLGVDLVLCGHSHSYERSFLVRGHYGVSSTLSLDMLVDHGDGRIDGNGAYKKPSMGKAAEEGAVYAVAGSSGQIAAAPLDHPVMVASLLSLGSMVVDVRGRRLDARFIDEKGVVRDSFTIEKGVTKVTSVPSATGPVPALAIDGVEPNPLRGAATIRCAVPARGRYELSVADVAGRRVRVIADAELSPGERAFAWDGRDARGAPVSAGVYFVRLTGPGGARVARLAVVR